MKDLIKYIRKYKVTILRKIMSHLKLKYRAERVLYMRDAIANRILRTASHPDGHNPTMKSSSPVAAAAPSALRSGPAKGSPRRKATVSSSAVAATLRDAGATHPRASIRHNACLKPLKNTCVLCFFA